MQYAELPLVERDRLVVEIVEITPASRVQSGAAELAANRRQGAVGPSGVVQADDQQVGPVGQHEFLCRRQRNTYRPGVEVTRKTLEYTHDVEVQRVQGAVGGAHHHGDEVARAKPHRLGDTLAEQNAENVVVGQLPALHNAQVGAELCFLVRFDALTDDREIAPPIVQQAAEVQSGRHPFHAFQRSDPCRDIARCVDEVSIRLSRALLDEARAEYLHVPGARLDHRLAELGEDVLDETPCEDQAGDAERDRRQRHAGSDDLAKDVAQRECKQHPGHR